MYLLRQIEESDADQVYRLAMQAHAGVTSLPKNRELIQKKIERSLDSFRHVQQKRMEGLLFLFVLENLATNELVGVSGIKSGGGKEIPLHHYAIQDEVRDEPKELLSALKKTKVLIPERARTPFSELCSLFLTRKERSSGIGRLLSLARFLFIKAHPAPFEKEIKASLRGVFTEEDLSPFYENVGRKFVDLPYDSFVDHVRKDPTLILAAIPSFPITIELLMKEAQAAIGAPHKNTMPAKHLLEAQGFIFDNEVDLLDAGPILKGQLTSLRPWINSKRGPLSQTSFGKDKTVIVANTAFPFKATLCAAKDAGSIPNLENLLKSIGLSTSEDVISLEL